jgi:hypothetical protein
MSMYMSLRCKFCFQRLYIWNCSNVFISGPFFSKCSIILLVCPLFRVCCCRCVVCLGCVVHI